MNKGKFGVKIDYDNENIIKQKYEKISDIKKLVHKLEMKFK